MQCWRRLSKICLWEKRREQIGRRSTSGESCQQRVVPEDDKKRILLPGIVHTGKRLLHLRIPTRIKGYEERLNRLGVSNTRHGLKVSHMPGLFIPVLSCRSSSKPEQKTPMPQCNQHADEWTNEQQPEMYRQRYTLCDSLARKLNQDEKGTPQRRQPHVYEIMARFGY